MKTSSENKTDMVMEHLRSLCSAREYAPDDIRRKVLKMLGEDSAAAAQDIVSSLISEGFLSASRYARAFARDKSSLAGWGPVKIRFALRSKGIDEVTIADALSKIDADRADEKFIKLLSSRRKTLENDPQIRLKLLKFALSRGYDYDAAAKAVAAVLSR